MSWLTVIWSMIASACLTLAGMHWFVWCRRRKAHGNLLFAISAAGTAAAAGCELWMMHAKTVAEFGNALRWMHLPSWVVILSLVGFVRVYLRAGRQWLAWTVCGVRTLSLILNFVFTPNLNFREITDLRYVGFLGESVAVAVGVPNPWMLIGQASLLLMVVFVMDAAVTVWRRGEHRKAILVGFSMVFLFLVGTAQVILAMWSGIHGSFTPSLLYLGIVAGMALELSEEVLHASKLSRDLRESEQRMSLAVDAANFGIWIRDFTRNEIWASDKWRELFGFAPTERLELDLILARVHPDDRAAVREVLEQAVTTDGRYDAEYRAVLPDGKLRGFPPAAGSISMGSADRSACAASPAIAPSANKPSRMWYSCGRRSRTWTASR